MSAGSTYAWSRHIVPAVLAINTRLIRIHGYRPALLMLGYQPTHLHINSYPNADAGRQWAEVQRIEDPRVYQLAVETRAESWTIATDRRVEEQARMAGSKTPMRRLPEAGDLVLIRDQQRDKSHGPKARQKMVRTLTTRQENASRDYRIRPRTLRRWDSKEYHLDDLITWVERDYGKIPVSRNHWMPIYSVTITHERDNGILRIPRPKKFHPKSILIATNNILLHGICK